MGFGWGDITGGLSQGLGFLPIKNPGLMILEELLGGKGGGDNKDDDIPDPFQAIGDAFSSPYVKIGLLAGGGYLAYSMLKDDK